MSLSENIRDAFIVVEKTYENVYKLIRYCQSLAGEQRCAYVSLMDRFLRYKSDNDIDGWLIKDFIILFQRKDDKRLHNGLRDGPIFGIEIDLAPGNPELLPTVYLTRFQYRNIASWKNTISPADHWGFYWPLRNKDIMNFDQQNGYNIAVPKTPEFGDEKYWGLERVYYTNFLLTELTAENVAEKIFGGFDMLEAAKQREKRGCI